MVMGKIKKVIIHTLTRGNHFFSQFSKGEIESILTVGEIKPAEPITNKKEISKAKMNSQRTTNNLYKDIEKMINQYGPEKIEEILNLKKENTISEKNWVLTKHKSNEYREVKTVDITEDKILRYEITGVNDQESVWVTKDDIIDIVKLKDEPTQLDYLFLYQGRRPDQWKLGDVAFIVNKSNLESRNLFDFTSTHLMFINSDVDLEIIKSFSEKKACIPLVFRENRLDYLYMQGFDQNLEEEKTSENQETDMGKILMGDVLDD